MATLPDFFGLNLGHNSIKIVQSKGISSTKARLVSIGSTPTAYGILENDSLTGIDSLSKEVEKAYKTVGLKTKNCVMSVPEVLVFSRLITLPKVKEEEESQAIQWALKPLVPILLENLNISYLKIDEKILEGNSFVDWYVVAAPKALIERYQQVMEKAGINLLAVETEALAITRMIALSYPQEFVRDIMIIDMGAESTNVILSRNGVVMFSQTISTGSNTITKVIAADFGIDIIQAEKYKITYGLNPQEGEGKIAKSIEPVIEIIIGEIQRTITYYKEKIGGSGISKMFLTGGGADLPYLDKFLGEKLNISAQTADPLLNFDIDRGLKNEIQQLHLKGFNVAVGLSLKGYIL